MQMLRIERQTVSGAWAHVGSCANNGQFLMRAFKDATSTGLSGYTNRVRAIDPTNGSVVDMYQG